MHGPDIQLHAIDVEGASHVLRVRGAWFNVRGCRITYVLGSTVA